MMIYLPKKIKKSQFDDSASVSLRGTFVFRKELSKLHWFVTNALPSLGDKSFP